MPRILYVITELDPGGAEKALFELVVRLDRERFEPEVACLSGRGEVGLWLEDRGVTVHYLDASAWCAPGALMRLWSIVRRGRFDVVHTFLFHANALGRVAARLARVPVVVSSVRVEEPRRWHQWVDALTHRLADRIVCVSESTARFFCERCHAPAGKVLSIPNGVDAARFAVRERRARERLRVASVGRLAPQKGCDVLIDVAHLCTRQGLDAEFVIAGDGPLRGELQARIERLGLRDRVQLMGYCADVAGLLGSADVFVSASRWEGMPNAVLEAMAAGLPVAATAVGGTGELVVDGESGRLAPADDAAALAEAVGELLRDGGLRRALGDRARKRVLEQFTWEQNAARHAALYEELLGGLGTVRRTEAQRLG